MKKVLLLFAACFMLLTGNLSAQNYWQEIYCTFNLNFSINGQNKNVSSEIPKNLFPVPLEFNSSDYGTFLYEPGEDNPMPPEDPSIMPEPKPGFFNMLPDGNYEVTFQRFIPHLDFIGSLPIFIKPDFEPRQNLAYVLNGKYNLKIKVVDIDTGEPITNCPINYSMYDPNIQLYFDENILTNASGEIAIESIGSSGNTLSISKEPITGKYEFIEASYKATKDNYSPVYRLFLPNFSQVENEVTISLKKIIPPIIVEPNYGDPTIVLTTTSQGSNYSFLYSQLNGSAR